MDNIKFIFFILIYLFPNLIAAQNKKNIKAEINKLYEVNENEAGFSIAVFKGDSIILERQYGNANLDYDIPITEKTVFDIGSIAKQFTAAAILLLEEEKKLSIKDPVYKHIDNFPRYKKGDPTIEHLLNQTSGIKEIDPYLGVIDITFRDLITQSQLLNIATKIDELYFTPGEYFYYSNINYILLASIIEKISGKSYSEYLQEAIFKPLEMKNTVVNTSTYNTIKNRAIGYTEDEGEFYKTHQYSLFYVGDGQILTTPRDIFKWHQNLRKSIIGTPSLWKKMHTKAKLNDGTAINYGLGVEFETHNSWEANGFDGMITSGFVSKYLYFPALDIAFFTTQNTFDWDFRERFFQFVDLYVPSKKTEIQLSKYYKKIKLSKDELKKYEGNYLFYYNDEDRKANAVKLMDDKLKVLTLDGDEIAPLIPVGNHKFLFGEDGDAILEFDLDNNLYTYDDFENEKPWVFNKFQPYEHSSEELKEFEGEYFSSKFQISKKIVFEDKKLLFYYRNGAWKEELGSLTKDVLEISISPIEFVRNSESEIIGFTLMDIFFKKI